MVKLFSNTVVCLGVYLIYLGYGLVFDVIAPLKTHIVYASVLVFGFIGINLWAGSVYYLKKNFFFMFLWFFLTMILFDFLTLLLIEKKSLSDFLILEAFGYWYFVGIIFMFVLAFVSFSVLKVLRIWQRDFQSQ